MDKKTGIAFILIFFIIILMPKYFEIFAPQSEKKTNTNDIQIQQAQPSSSQQLDSQTIKTTIQNKRKQEDLFNLNIPEQLYTINTDLYTAVLSSKGGGTLKSFHLKNYNQFNTNDTSLVNLVNNSGEAPLLIKYISISSGIPETLSQNFLLTSSNISLPSNNIFTISENQSLELVFSLKNDSASVTKTLTFFADKYYFDLDSDLTGIASNIAPMFYSLVWNNGMPYTEPNKKYEDRYVNAFAHASRETEKLTLKNEHPKSTQFDGNTEWTALRNKYFAAAFIPQNSASGYRLFGFGEKKDDYVHKYFGMDLLLPKTQTNLTKIYIGPLKKDLLTDTHENLDDLMSFGFKLIKPISKFVLWSFINLYKIIPNYGFVLIIFSILIKVVLSPLTIKSNQSMKEMHKIQPLMTELKEKYKDDPQKMNQATMKLYKEHGVNPMGGCLPVLLQMPILISLFTVFRSTIELRHAPFVFWITDLSAPDALFTLPFVIPFYGQQFNVIPLLMAASQVIQMKFSGQSTSPQQKQMMYFMPVMMFFLFNNFPSGLNLYYTLFNILTIVQQKYFTPDAKTKVKSNKPKKTSIQRLREIRKSR